MDKPKVYNTENSSKYLEFLTNGRVSVKEYRKNGTSILICNNCKEEFKYRLCDFIRRYNDGDFPHNCNRKNKKVTKEIFLQKLNEENLNDEYTFLEDFVDYSTKILCRHNICGNEWKVAPRHFVGTMKTRCPICSKNHKSKYEELIKDYLTLNKINFIYNYSNEELKKKSFDFAILNENNEIIGLIEFDGEQHDKKKFNMTDKEFDLQKKSDKFKDNYAKKHKIPLTRIKYKNKNNYKKIIEEFLININGSTTIETK